jgi:hypothetical protein
VKPFEVYNPSAGRTFMLHWWTEHDRGHVAFASTRQALLDVARGVFEMEPNAKTKAILEIEFVAPSDRMNQIAAKYDYQDRVESLFHDFMSRITEAASAGLAVPPPFYVCEKYEPEEEAKEDDDWMEDCHYSCTNCTSKIRLVGMTKEDLYVNFYDDWSATKPHENYPKRKGQPSRVVSCARKASDDEPLWYARANFGHHQGGVELHEVSLADVEEDRPSCLVESTLFFFRLLEPVDSALVQQVSSISEAAQLTKKADDERREDVRRKAMKNERISRIVVALDFFNRPEARKIVSDLATQK